MVGTPEEPKRRKTLFSYFKPLEENITEADTPFASNVADSQPPLNSPTIDNERVEDGVSRAQQVGPSEAGDITLFQRDPGLRLQIWPNPVDKQDGVQPAYLDVQSKEVVKKNRVRLKASIDCARYLAYQALAFGSHDEPTNSTNRGNFIELISLLATVNDEIAEVVLENAPENATYTSPEIQKEILSIFANKVRNKIREEVGSSKFCILVDEAEDEFYNEQMTIVLRFVDGDGFIKERLLDVLHVKNTTALTFKQAIMDVFVRHDLQIANMRGQGYDGASIQGAFNELQALFLRDCQYAYYVHWFAHGLQLALVRASEEVSSIWQFFSKLHAMVNFVSTLPIRQSELQSSELDEIVKMLANGELETGKGASEIGKLQRDGATSWNSHLHAVKSMIDMFGATCVIITEIMETSTNVDLRGQSEDHLITMTSFEFVFILHLMFRIMEVTDMLCQALQRESEDIVNAMKLVRTTRLLLQKLREDGWDAFIEHVQLFCNKYGVLVPDMNAPYLVGTRHSCQQCDCITVAQHYHLDIFNDAIDLQLAELNTRFTESTMELLILSSALDPRDAYKSFKSDAICSLAEKFYSADFDNQDLIILRCQLLHYELDVPKHPKFQNLSSISELCRRLVETRKSECYDLIYRLICLVLTLPVSTATIERAFSARKLVETKLCTEMDDDFFRDCMTIHIEREIGEQVDSDSIMDDFYSLKDRKTQLK